MAHLSFALALAVKMAITAGLVVAAAAIAERAGPLLGALVATLPISAGPAYVFVSLDHGPAFIAASALASLAMNAATSLLALTYVLLAQRRGRAVRFGAALGVWLVSALLLRLLPWTLGGAVALNGLVLALGIPISRALLHPPMPPLVRRRYDVPARAALVVLLVALVVGLSGQLGPALTGVLAVFPVVLSSLILIFDPRIGPKPTAALIAQAIPGLGGFAVALAVLHGAAVPLGTPAALALALVVSLGVNIMLWIGLRRRL
jgi:hypothetical protein